MKTLGAHCRGTAVRDVGGGLGVLLIGVVSAAGAMTPAMTVFDGYLFMAGSAAFLVRGLSARRMLARLGEAGLTVSELSNLLGEARKARDRFPPFLRLAIPSAAYQRGAGLLVAIGVVVLIGSLCLLSTSLAAGLGALGCSAALLFSLVSDRGNRLLLEAGWMLDAWDAELRELVASSADAPLRLLEAPGKANSSAAKASPPEGCGP